MAEYSDYIAAVEVMSGGTNKVIFDDVGLPSIMVAFPKMKYSDVFTDDLATDEILPAFVFGGIEKDVVWVSKYQNVVINSRAYSLPNKTPKSNINFDTSVQVCRQKGNGWALMPNSVWAAIALWSKVNGTMPSGNNNYGSDKDYPYEKGITATTDGSGKTRVIKTGSGIASWHHNADYSGIADLCGNVREWITGLRTVGGEIHIITTSDCFSPLVDFSAASSCWKALNENGDFVEPGTNGTIKLDYKLNKISLATTLSNQSSSTRYALFSEIQNGGLTVPNLLYSLAILPSEISDYKNDMLMAKNEADMEYVLQRGGGYDNGVSAGIFHLKLNSSRTNASASLGFRSAFCAL